MTTHPKPKTWNIRITCGAWSATVPIKHHSAKEAHRLALDHLNTIAPPINDEGLCTYCGRDFNGELKNSDCPAEDCPSHDNLYATPQELLDALISALPFIEDALLNPAYKQEPIKLAIARTRAVIKKATGGDLS